MRFQTRETVHTPDQEMVLRTLEMCLKDVSTEIIRKPSQITFHGLGPSSHSKNPQDTTVLFVDAENNETIIEAYVVFQASSLLGEIAQGEIVRSKLDQVFHEMKMWIDAHPPAATEAVALHVAAPAIETIEEREPMALATQEAAEPLKVLEWASSPSARESTEKDREVEAEGVLPVRSRRVALVAALSILVLMTSGAYLVRLYHHKTASRTFAIGSRSAAVHDGLSAGGTNKPAVRPSSQELVSADSVAQSDLNAADPKVWLQGWVAAMRTRDAVAQASFYADPVDRYLHQSNVSRDAVLKEKQAAIADRKGLWTIRLEKIVIEKPGESEAAVRFVKHFIDQPAPAEISERFVRTRFTLKRVDGQWKITSERELP